jgi:hypothetical protein
MNAEEHQTTIALARVHTNLPIAPESAAELQKNGLITINPSGRSLTEKGRLELDFPSAKHFKKNNETPIQTYTRLANKALANPKWEDHIPNIIKQAERSDIRDKKAKEAYTLAVLTRSFHDAIGFETQKLIITKLKALHDTVFTETKSTDITKKVLDANLPDAPAAFSP